MQDRYWLFRRENGVYYIQDRTMGRQESLKTKDKAVAKQMLAARNQASAQPMLNVAMAKAYLVAKSPEMFTRTWSDAMKHVEQGYQGPTLERWRKVMISEPFQSLLKLPLLYTDSAHFLAVLCHPRAGVSANVWLRILHNRVLDLGWILSPVLSRKLWPKVRYKEKRGTTWEEHQRIIDSEWNDEYRLYYDTLWETGGAQTDIANLQRDNIDTLRNCLVYRRQKLNGRSHGGAALAIGRRLQGILDQLPQAGWLFPNLRLLTETHRASRFRKRCLGLSIKGITLHCYRYSWAERAKSAGMPLREAMAHLGHQSRAVHLSYASSAEVITLPLEHYEQQKREKIVQFKAQPDQIAQLQKTGSA
jgi:hypothetical protein